MICSHLFLNTTQLHLEYSSTLSSTAQLSQVQLKSLKYISLLSSTTRLSQVQLNSLKYHSTISSRAHLSQVQIKSLKCDSITYVSSMLSIQTTQCILDTMSKYIICLSYVWFIRCCVTFFYFPAQLIGKCYPRLPLRNHILWKSGAKHYEEKFVPVAFKLNNVEFQQCIVWCFKQELMYRKRIKDPRFDL